MRMIYVFLWSLPIIDDEKQLDPRYLRSRRTEGKAAARLRWHDHEKCKRGLSDNVTGDMAIGKRKWKN